MNCTNCGSELQEGIKFCTNCGTKIESSACNEPVNAEPVYEEPTSEAPKYEEPTCEVPKYEEPTCETPKNEDRTVEAPVYERPVYQPYQTMPNYDQPAEQKGLSIASLVLGISALLFVCIPFIGIVMGIIGLVLGIIGRKKGAKGVALAGIITSSIAIGVGVLYIVGVFAFAFVATFY